MKLKILSLILFFSSCIREIPFPEQEIPSKMVVGCLFGADSLFNIYVYKTQNVFDTSENYIANAQVELWQDNQPVELVTHIKNGLYRSNTHAQIGVNYTVKISAPGFETIEASDMIPDKQNILKTELEINKGWDYEYFSKYSELNLWFDNNPEEDIYTEFFLVFRSWIFQEIIYPDRAGEDTILYNSIVPYIKSEDVFIQAENYNFDGVTTINSLIFSNELIADRTAFMRVHFFKTNTEIGSSARLVVYFKSISKKYYLYKTTLRKHIENQKLVEPSSLDDYSELLLSGKQTDVYSNVKNGYGIFAGYSLDTVSFAVDKSDFY